MRSPATSSPAVHLVEFSARIRPRRAAASLDLLRGGRARRARGRRPEAELHAGGRRGFRRGARMAVAAGVDPRKSRRAGRARKWKRRCGARRWAAHAMASHRPGRGIENLIRKNRLRWMRNRLTRAGTRRAHRLGLAEHLYLHQESWRVPAGDARRRLAHRDCAAVDRGNIHRSSHFAAGTRASILPRRFPICWAPISGNCPRTSASAWT